MKKRAANSRFLYGQQLWCWSACLVEERQCNCSWSAFTLTSPFKISRDSAELSWEYIFRFRVSPDPLEAFSPIVNSPWVFINTASVLDCARATFIIDTFTEKSSETLKVTVTMKKISSKKIMLISGKMFSLSDFFGVEDKRMQCFIENPTVLAVWLRQDLVQRLAAVMSHVSQSLVAEAVVRS